MKTLEERFDSAASAIKAVLSINDLDESLSHWVWAMTDAALRHGFPELFDGSHVLMPREPTEEMMDAFGDEEAEAFWRACVENRKRRKELIEKYPDQANRRNEDVLAAAFCQTFPSAYAHMISAYESNQGS